jgi:phosphoribosylcarboxyaminoimidazole (NCAIR) mutase
METTVKLIVHSQLSDAMVEMELNPILAKTRIKFVKFLISSHRMDDEINPDSAWEIYISALSEKIF